MHRCAPAATRLLATLAACALLAACGEGTGNVPDQDAVAGDEASTGDEGAPADDAAAGDEALTEAGDEAAAGEETTGDETTGDEADAGDEAVTTDETSDPADDLAEAVDDSAADADDAGDEAAEGDDVATEPDEDVDAAPEVVDECPLDPDKTLPGLCGCGTPDADSDFDGTPDCEDDCATDPLKTLPGACGCGAADTDSDSDGTADCLDGCPDDPAKVAPGTCGCGVADTPNCAEVEPPVPDPMEWEEPPHATGTTTIAMTAATAADPSGVDYYFECYAGPCHDSGWQDGPAYEDSGLAPDYPYGYRVRARDRSLNTNTGAWSADAYAVTERDEGFASGLEARFFDFDGSLQAMPDLSGRTPDVARIDPQLAYWPGTAPWAGLPQGLADTFASRHGGFLRVVEPGVYTLSLVSDDGSRLYLGADLVVDIPGAGVPTEASAVRYLTAGYHPIRVEFYDDAGPATLVLYREGPGIAKEVVPPEALYHADPPDFLPPDPNPMKWEQPPAATGPGSIAMKAVAASDPAAVQYGFECVLGACHDSGWQTGRTFEDTGLAPGTQYAWRVRARDFGMNENASQPSGTSSATTDTYVPDVVGLGQAMAEATLGMAALATGGVVEEYSDTVPAGVVIGQSPAAGTLVPAGAGVDLVVSKGIEPVVVPDVAGMTQADAEAAIFAARLAIGAIATAASCTVAPGNVTSQQPAGGSVVPKGSAVGMVVSRGPEQVVITELMYHPGNGLAREEFVELYNPCAYPVQLGGWQVQGLGSHTFAAGATIPASGYVVLAQDAAAFQAAYGFAPDFTYAGAQLSNSGELLQVTTAAGEVADEVTYADVPPWPVTPDGLGPSMEVIDPSQDNATPRNWHASIDPAGRTPRAVNSVDAEGLPPWISEVSHGTPAPGAQIHVTAKIEDATVATLTHVIDWGSPATVPMLDDGANGDGQPGDGVYGATLPAQVAGTLVRYRIDAAGPTGTMGFPRDDDTVQYSGTYLAPATTTDLDVFHWIINPVDYTDALSHIYTDQTEPALLFHAGVLYDGVRIRVRGQSSRGWPKKHWNFQFAQGHHFDAAGYTVAPVGGFNMQSSYADKSYLRETLSYETFRDAGCPSNVITPVALFQNGQFFGLYAYLEDRDADNLERNGIDPDGNLYRAVGSQCESKPLAELPGPWEKDSPKDGDYSDLFAFLTGVNQGPGIARRAFLFDNVDIPEMINYQAASVIIHNNDQPAKNYFLYHDTLGTGRWSMQPWDMDLTFGRNYQGKVLNDDIFANLDVVAGRPNVSPSHPLFGDSEHQKWDYLWNRLIDALLEEPDIRQMYYRRLRTLMDELLVEGRYESRIDQLAALTADEAEADRQKWGWYGVAETPAQAVARMKQEYLAVRRTHLFATHRVDGEIPPAQSASPVVVINELMYNPYTDPGNPADPGDELEFIELHNPSATESVDVSGWSFVGVDLKLPAGSVILPQGYLLVVRNDVLFRQAYGPGLFVAGQYGGKLDGGGEPVALLDRTGAVVDAVEYDDAAPWPVTPDGGGPSLELIDPALDNAMPSSWAASLSPGGTPGAQNGVP
jgi:hypothetical protein